MSEPLKTPLFDWHRANQGRIVDFAGWAMPVQYSSIIAEHEAVRKSAGLFDVSHMGRLEFTGE
ncbi:MAG: glycine cleavage system protein T, partial [Isosphaeraceae bacterium]